MDALTLARWQFGVTTVYHFFFVPLTLGLSILVALMQTLYYRTGDDVYKRMTKFWGKLFLINFAMGVVTGIVHSERSRGICCEPGVGEKADFSTPVPYKNSIRAFSDAAEPFFRMRDKGSVLPGADGISRKTGNEAARYPGRRDEAVICAA